VFVPLAPLRLVLAGAGAALVLIGGYWAKREGKATPMLVLLVGAAALAGFAPKPSSKARSLVPEGAFTRVIHRAQSATGLVQVLEVPDAVRILLIDGVAQGGMDLASGASRFPMSEYMSFLGHRYHPHAKKALLLGLGCGVLAKTLAGMGLDVTAAEIEPEVANAARAFFGLPGSVRIAVEDARTFVANTQEKYDLVVLDAYAGETSPWYLLTREGLSAIRERLAPGGRMVVNCVTKANGETEGLKRLEAGLLDVFGEALVFIEPRLPNEAEQLVNATLVAGRELVASDEPYPATPSKFVAPYLGDLRALEPRPARTGGRIDTDDHSSLDSVEASVRLQWRDTVISALGPEVLQD
jgi:spermidine synthase